MQYLSRDVFPEPQFEGAKQNRQRGSGSGETPKGAGGRGRGSWPSTASEAPLVLATQDSARAPSPSSPPSFFPAASAPREPSSVGPRRRTRDGSDEPPPAPGTEPCLRPGHRQAEAPSPSRASPTAEVSPQLLGRRTGSDADLLASPLSANSDSPPSSPPTASLVSPVDYHIARKESAAGKLQALLTPQGNSPLIPELATTPEVGQPKTPSTGSSASPQESLSSKASCASSFAHLLRDNRADRRLLRKKSLPVPHLQKHAPGSRSAASKLSEVKRTPSFYKPRIVDDSRAPVITKPMSPSPPKPASSVNMAHSINGLDDPSPRKLSPQPPLNHSPAQPLRQKRCSDAQNGSESTSLSPLILPTSSRSNSSVRPLRQARSGEGHRSESTAMPPPMLATPTRSTPPFKRPGLMKSATLADLSKYQPPVRRQSRALFIQSDTIEPPPSPKRERSRGRESRGDAGAKLVRPGKLKHLGLPSASKAPALIREEHYHNVTPPEAEPGSPRHLRFRRGDHYFRTFGGETMYVREFTPTMMPTTPDLPTPTNLSPLSSPVVPDRVVARRPAVPIVPSPATISPSLQLTLLPEPEVRRPSDTGTQRSKRKRKRSSIFKLFHKSEMMDRTYETRRSSIIGTRPRSQASPVTPDISVSPPPMPTPQSNRASVERTSSEMSLPPYFAQPRALQHSSDEAASPRAISPGKEESARRRPSMHGRLPSSKSSDEVTPSPMTWPRSRLRHRAALADMNEDDDEDLTVVATPKWVPAVASQLTLRTAEKFARPATILGFGAQSRNVSEVKFAPPETRRISASHEEPGRSPPGMKRSIRNFFSAMRDQPHATPITPTTPVTPTPGAETPEPPRTKCRISSPRKSSFANLFHSKPSSSKLFETASQATIEPETPISPKTTPKKYSLEVNDFVQTPYAKRVADNRRAEINQVKAWQDEVLDDNDADEVQFGFELGVPDHLPHSPLCPLSPKHKSGGKAICPLHGRKAPAPQKVMKLAIMKTVKVEPQIVYEGVVEGTRSESSSKTVDLKDVKGRRLSGDRMGDAWYEEGSEHSSEGTIIWH